MSKTNESDETKHLEEIEDGAGCVEIWERLSETRDETKDEVEADEDEVEAGAEADDD